MDLVRMPLDRQLFVQRWLSCGLALKNDVCFLPNDDYLRSGSNPSARTEFAIRSGDWAIREWMDHADMVLNEPGAASEFSEEERQKYGLALRSKVFQMFDLYMQQSMARVGPAGTEELVRSVLADPRFTGDIVFWEFLFNGLLGMAEAHRPLFTSIFERLRPGGATKAPSP